MMSDEAGAPRRSGSLVCGASAAARADVDVKFGGQIASDIRYRLGGEEVPPADRDGAVSVAAAPAARTDSRATRT